MPFAALVLLTGSSRACGEQLMIKNLDSVYEESSPRVRGAVALQVESALAFGIIPECVGSRNCRSLRWCCRRDHPHACGEEEASSPVDSTSLGSSPRMGNRCPAESRGPPHPDHPRVCEEHFRPFLSGYCLRESSPRVRGAAIQLLGEVLGRGIIPARAGSSHTPCRR